MFERFKNTLRKVVRSMASNVLFQDKEVANASYTTDVMTGAIQKWLSMYMLSVRSDDDFKTLGLPAAIASEFARLVTLELEYKIVVPGNEESENTRAEYLSKQFEPFLKYIRRYTEYGCACGGVMFKPYIDGKNIAVDVCIANDFYPLAFNSKGKITKCAFVEHKRVGNKYYHRIEKHEFIVGDYVVTNEAFVSYKQDTKGKPCSLTEVEEWSSLTEEQHIKNVKVPLFSYFAVPSGNCEDPHSPLGVSVYSRAVPQINEADRQWERYLWEYEGGELMVEASREAFPIDKDGKPVVPSGKERLFWITEFESKQENSTLTKFHSPSFRDASLKAGLNAILQRIEFNCGLAYGTFSDPQQIEKTAEEIKASKQRSYSTVKDIQKALKETLDDLVAAMNVYADLYKLSPSGKYEINDVWDDSIIVDSETERARDLNEVRMGIMQKWEYRVKWYGESEETAKAAVAKEEKDDWHSV